MRRASKYYNWPSLFASRSWVRKMALILGLLLGFRDIKKKAQCFAEIYVTLTFRKALNFRLNAASKHECVTEVLSLVYNIQRTQASQLPPLNNLLFAIPKSRTPTDTCRHLGEQRDTSTEGLCSDLNERTESRSCKCSFEDRKRYMCRTSQ